MASNITRTQTPEERELAAKNAELAVLETQLAQRELDFATLQIELHAFEQRYLRIVGVKFSEIDDLEAQIAEVLNRRNPADEAARSRAANARAKATESAAAAGSIEPLTHAVGFKPSDDLKRLYREIAKRIHPDLATDDAERAKRNQLMAEVNRAYAAGDETRLRAILDEWETSPDAVTGQGIGAELIRTLRKIHQVQSRLASLEVEIARLTGSELAVLKATAESKQINGLDLLARMAEQLDQQIVQLGRSRDALRSSEAQS
jgi:hypothetical protein